MSYSIVMLDLAPFSVSISGEVDTPPKTTQISSHEEPSFQIVHHVLSRWIPYHQGSFPPIFSISNPSIR